MNKSILLCILLLSLIITSTVAQDEEVTTPTSPGGGQIEQTGTQQLNNQFQQWGVNGQAAPGTQIISSGAGQIIVSGQVTINGQTYTGDNIVIYQDGRVDLPGQFSLGNGATGSGAKGITADGKDNYQMAQVNSLTQNQITITNGVNVQWNNGVLTADSAGSLDYKGSTSTDVIKLTADGSEFSVQKAAAVQAGCFLVEDVEIAKFKVGQSVTMTTSGNGNVVYGAGTKIAYDGMTSDSSLTASVTSCMKPTYAVKNMTLTSTRDGMTERVNGTGRIEMNPDYGVVCVNLTPVSMYDLDQGGYDQNFGFLIKEAGYKLCIQKAIAQRLEADCLLCGLVDLANRKLVLNGVIEYRRYWYDSALIEPDKQRAFRSLGMGKNVLSLDNKDVLIEEDAPGIGTYVSNYLELHEHDDGGTTHRFLGIHEDIDRIAAQWLSAYWTSYSTATTTIIDNRLDYQRDDCKVTVLPPNHPQINAFLNSLPEVRFP